MTRDMNDISRSIVNFIAEKEEELVLKVMTHENKESRPDAHILHDIFVKFIRRFKENLEKKSSEDRLPFPLIDFEIKDTSLSHPVSVTAIIDGIYDMSRTVWTMFEREARDRFNLSSEELLNVHDLLNKEIKQAVKEILHMHVSATTRNEERFDEKITELSVPIINITESTAVCPLIGTIDEKRGKHLMHSALQQCRDRKINRLIFDMSGVPHIDDIVADYINSVVKSLLLIGVHITLTGVRSNIAMTVIQQDINFENVDISSTVRQALEDLNIVKKAEKENR